MKRTALRRKTPLKAKGGSRFPKRRDPKYLAWIRTLGCVIGSGCEFYPDRRRIEAAHLKTKGSGGYDRGNAFPACPKHHDEQEGKTAAFERRHRINLAVVCAALDDAYTREVG